LKYCKEEDEKAICQECINNYLLTENNTICVEKSNFSNCEVPSDDLTKCVKCLDGFTITTNPRTCSEDIYEC